MSNKAVPIIAISTAPKGYSESPSDGRSTPRAFPRSYQGPAASRRFVLESVLLKG
jgi:hypothetical protein